MTVMNALELARSYGVRFLRKPDGGIRYQAAAAPPPDVVAVLAAAKPDFLRVLAGREAAKAALNAAAPIDCLPHRWVAAQEGLKRFIADGWGDQAALLGWTADELYRIPPLWSRVDLTTGAALLVGERRMIVTHRGIYCDRDAIRLAAQVSPDRAGASGMSRRPRCFSMGTGERAQTRAEPQQPQLSIQRLRAIGEDFYPTPAELGTGLALDAQADADTSRTERHIGLSLDLQSFRSRHRRRPSFMGSAR